VRDKTCRWLYNPRSSNREKDGAPFQCLENSVQLEGHLSEPANVRSNFSATIAAWEFFGRLVKLGIEKGWPVATVAPAFEKLAMHVHEVLRTRILVQSIHILGAKEQPVAKRFFKPRKREMAGIRASAFGGAAAHGVILPDEPRVAAPRLRRCHFFETVIPPQSVGISICGDAALGADTSSGEYKHSVAPADL
jgi:hypothetical protein